MSFWSCINPHVLTPKSETESIKHAATKVNVFRKVLYQTMLLIKGISKWMEYIDLWCVLFILFKLILQVYFCRFQKNQHGLPSTDRNCQRLISVFSHFLSHLVPFKSYKHEVFTVCMYDQIVITKQVCLVMIWSYIHTYSKYCIRPPLNGFNRISVIPNKSLNWSLY